MQMMGWLRLIGKSANMDPNATLEEIRALCESINDDNEYGPDGIDQNEAYQLMCLVEALDGWLCNKGFLPDDWNK